eukprot:TRINITY_DN102126_c0_g1_i1.p1 TRINITY_DN102126_c0_g1~~TRINITY_DN102126_c0_g1_i1.p1  ORF type:complete len:405 (+),score=50.91 TRINITY_DN102126_c0_g1_i1:64-1278(+)
MRVFAACAAVLCLARFVAALRLGDEGITEPAKDFPENCPSEEQTPPAFPYEFGWEMNIGVPHAYFLQQCGKLKSTQSCSLDFAAYYWFSPSHKVVDCEAPKSFLFGMQWEDIGVASYLRNAPLKRWWVPPHKRFYTALPIQSTAESLLQQEASKELDGARALTWDVKSDTGIAILNKHHAGNNGGFLSASMLQRVMEKIGEKCPDTNVMYYRNWAFHHDESDSVPMTIDDGNTTEGQALAANSKAQTLRSVAETQEGLLQTQENSNNTGLAESNETSASDLELRQLERAIVKNNPRGSLLQELLDTNRGMTLQEIQMRVLSRFNCFISVHGGNSELAANFGGQMLVFIQGLAWYDRDETFARLSGLAGSKITRVHDESDLLQHLDTFTTDYCSKCKMTMSDKLS